MKNYIFLFVFFISLSACSPKQSASASLSTSTTNSMNSNGVNGSNVANGGNGTSGGTLSNGTSTQNVSSLVQQYLNAKAQAQKFQASIQNQLTLRSNLMLDLMANAGVGCMSDVKINSIEIIIDGQKLNDNDVTTLKQGDQFLPQPIAGTTNFDFTLQNLQGNNAITFTNNEQTNPIFAPGAHYTYTVPAGQSLNIGSVGILTIRKENVAYNLVNYCPPKTPACSMVSTIKEVERYKLNSLTVKINDRIFYTHGQINHIFAANAGSESGVTSQSWQDNNVQLNESFIVLLQQNQCATQ